MKYRKKPIIIEAYQTDVELNIETLEGVMHASVGDYIITGINGEKYPCKPDIFEKTYELVEESNYKLDKGLQAFKDLLKQLFPNYDVDVSFDDICNLNGNLNIIRNALIENQERIEELEETNHLMFIREHKNAKKLKTLELLKKNLVIAFEEDNGIDLPALVVGMKTDKNKLCIIYSTQDKEEIDLLKEVLK